MNDGEKLNPNLIDDLHCALLTYGLRNMRGPIEQLARWIQDPPKGGPVTVACKEVEPRKLVSGILTTLGLECREVDDPNQGDSESRAEICLPSLHDRLEDLPLITEFLICQYLDIHDMNEPSFISEFSLANLFFLCDRYESLAGLKTPVLSYDEYINFIKAGIRDGEFDKNPIDMIEFEYPNADGITFRKSSLRLFMILNNVLPKERRTIRIPYNILREIPPLYYVPEDDQIYASKIAPNTIDGTNGGHISPIVSIASGDFRNYMLQILSEEDIINLTEQKISLKNIQNRMLEVGHKCITEMSVVEPKKIQGIFNHHNLIISKGFKNRNLKKPSPEKASGMTFYDIIIAVVDNYTINVYYPDNPKPVKYSYWDFGAVDQRNKNPNKVWTEFINCLLNGGFFERAKHGKFKDARKKMKMRIKEMLCSFFEIDEDPFKKYQVNQGWQLKIEVRDEVDSTNIDDLVY